MAIIQRLANLNWIAVVLSPVAVILMEVLWVYPWLVWAGEWPELDWQRPPLSLASLIVLISIAFFSTRLFLGRRWLLRWTQLGIVLVAIFVVVRIEYGAGFALLSGQWFAHTAQIFLDSFSHLHPIGLAPIVAVYLCWRGISLGRSPLYFNDVYRSFLFGLAALVLLIIVWAGSLGIGSLESLASTVGLHVAGFFFFGLTALALGNLQAIRRRMLREEMAPISSLRWLAILLGVVGGIVLLGIGTASIFSADFVALLGRVFNLVFDLLRQAVHYLLIPFGYLAERVFYAVQFILNLLRSEQPLEPFETPEFFEPAEIPGGAATQAAGSVVVLALKWTFFALIAIAVVFFLARALFRLRAFRAEAEVEEVHESLWSWQGFKADLRLFLSMLWRRWERKKKELVPVSAVPGWYLGEDAQGMLGIREIYRYLLWEASCFGITRRRHETPYEYARRLGQGVPEGSEQVGELTSLYVDVRYGEVEAEDRQVDYANSLWQVLRRLLRRPERNDSVESLKGE